VEIYFGVSVIDRLSAHCSCASPYASCAVHSSSPWHQASSGFPLPPQTSSRKRRSASHGNRGCPYGDNAAPDVRPCQENQTMLPCFTGGLEFYGDAVRSSATTPHPPPEKKINPPVLPRTTVPFPGPASTALPPNRRTGRMLATAAASRDIPCCHSFGVVLEVVALELDELIVTKAA